MTDCNCNQLVVKAQVEPGPAPTAQQVAMAGQPRSTQTAPNAPNTGAGQRAQNTTETQTPAVNPSLTAPSLTLTENTLNVPGATQADVSGNNKPAAPTEPPVTPLHAVEQPPPLEEILGNLADQKPDIQLEEQRLIHVSPTVCIPGNETSTAGASLSNLDRIGMGVHFTRSMRGTVVPVEGGQPSSSGGCATQTFSTHQEIQGLLTCANVGDVDILDLDVDGSEDFSDIDPDLADELLGGSPEEMIGNWVAKCNREVTAGLGEEIQPDLENGFQNLDLTDKVIPDTTTSAASSVTHALTAPTSPVTSKEEAPEEINGGHREAAHYHSCPTWALHL